MTEREALLRAVCSDPDDDTVRLVFADFLDEQGNEQDADRAAYIRYALENPAYEFVYLTAKNRDPFALLGIEGDAYYGWYGASSAGGLCLLGKWDKRHYVPNRGFVEKLKTDQELFCPPHRYEHIPTYGASTVAVHCGASTLLREDVGSARDGYFPRWCPVCWATFFPEHTGYKTKTIIDESPAKELFAKHPIQSVRLLDRDPHTPPGQFQWYESELEFTAADEQPTVLSRALFQRLPHKYARYVRGDYFDYTTEQDALSALSDACVLYGRELAGITVKGTG